MSLDVFQRIQAGLPIEFEWKFIADEEFINVNLQLYRLLNHIDRLYLYEYIFVILKEQLINSNRAIAKRVFFEEKNLDIQNPLYYKKYISEFRKQITENWNLFRSKMNEYNYFVKLIITYNKEELCFTIINNVKLLEVEKERIQIRMRSAYKYKTILDAYKDHLDEEESAGLGIIVSILFLRNMGLKENALNIFSEGNQTITTIKIPLSTIPKELGLELHDKITQEVKTLPSLSQSLQRIIQICNSSDMDMKNLISEIEKNPAVAADILKLSNSVGYLNYAKPNDISIAVKKLGSNGVLRMVYGIGTIGILNSKYPKLEEEWIHARRTSYYGERMCNELGLVKIADSVGIGGLLHDIGKILLLSIESKLFQELLQILKNRGMENINILEEVSLGMSHSEIGYLLAKKWNFPEDLTYMIACHHQPWNAPEEYLQYVEAVYLANMMAQVTRGEKNYYFVHLDILEKFSLNSEELYYKKIKEYERDFQKDEKERVSNA